MHVDPLGEGDGFAGIDNFQSDVISWTVLGAGALEEEGYTQRPMSVSEMYEEDIRGGCGVEQVGDGGGAEVGGVNGEGGGEGGREWGGEGEYTRSVECRGVGCYGGGEGGGVLLEVLLKKGSPAVTETEHAQGTASGAEVELELATPVSGGSLGVDYADSLDRKEDEGGDRGIGGLEEVTHEYHK